MVSLILVWTLMRVLRRAITQLCNNATRMQQEGNKLTSVLKNTAINRSSYSLTNMKDMCSYTGADLGGRGGGRPPPPSGIRPPADPKGPPFDTFSEIHFWRTDPKIFLKAPLAPIYTNFEGERAPKKTKFFCKNVSKSAQKRLF